jgi:hypothetical protein
MFRFLSYCAFLVCLALPNVGWTASCSCGPNCYQFRRGDINGDGKVNSSDVTLFAYLMYGYSSSWPQNCDACDVNDDGVINSTDQSNLSSAINGQYTIPAPRWGFGWDPTPDSINSGCDGLLTECTTFIRGDIDADGDVDSADATLLSNLYSGSSGAWPTNMDRCDIDDDGDFDYTDTTKLTQHNSNQYSIPEPHPTAGYDTTSDSINVCTCTLPSQETYCSEFIRGDVDGDDDVDQADETLLTNLLNGSSTAWPANADACDANDDGKIGAYDVYKLTLHRGGTYSIPEPHPAAGFDPTFDSINGECDVPHSTPSSTTYCSPFIRGDINEDGVINSSDLTLLGLLGSNSSQDWPANADACDVDDNGVFNTTDYDRLQQYINSTYTIPEPNDFNADYTSDTINPECDNPVWPDWSLTCSDFLRGDVNNNQSVNIYDVYLLADLLSGASSVWPPNVDACDVDDDGALTVLDATLLAQACINAYTITAPNINTGAGRDPTIDFLGTVCDAGYYDRTYMTFIRGDIDQDEDVDEDDIDAWSDCFVSDTGCPNDVDSMDVNGDNLVTTADFTYLYNYVYSIEPYDIPPPPNTETGAGADPTPDPIGPLADHHNSWRNGIYPRPPTDKQPTPPSSYPWPPPPVPFEPPTWTPENLPHISEADVEEFRRTLLFGAPPGPASYSYEFLASSSRKTVTGETDWPYFSSTYSSSVLFPGLVGMTQSNCGNATVYTEECVLGSRVNEFVFVFSNNTSRNIIDIQQAASADPNTTLFSKTILMRGAVRLGPKDPPPDPNNPPDFYWMCLCPDPPQGGQPNVLANEINIPLSHLTSQVYVKLYWDVWYCTPTGWQYELVSSDPASPSLPSGSALAGSELEVDATASQPCLSNGGYVTCAEDTQESVNFEFAPAECEGGELSLTVVAKAGAIDTFLRHFGWWPFMRLNKIEVGGIYPTLVGGSCLYFGSLRSGLIIMRCNKASVSCWVQ